MLPYPPPLPAAVSLRGEAQPLLSFALLHKTVTMMLVSLSSPDRKSGSLLEGEVLYTFPWLSPRQAPQGWLLSNSRTAEKTHT